MKKGKELDKNVQLNVIACDELEESGNKTLLAAELEKRKDG